MRPQKLFSFFVKWLTCSLKLSLSSLFKPRFLKRHFQESFLPNAFLPKIWTPSIQTYSLFLVISLNLFNLIFLRILWTMLKTSQAAFGPLLYMVVASANSDIMRCLQCLIKSFIIYEKKKWTVDRCLRNSSFQRLNDWFIFTLKDLTFFVWWLDLRMQKNGPLKLYQ